MDELQLKTSIENFDKIEYGIPIDEIRELGLRQFVKRVQRYIKKKPVSLYNWKPEWLTYVRERKNEYELAEDIPEILKELSSRNITLTPASTSSLIKDEMKQIIDEPYLDKYAKEIFESLTKGPCHLQNLIDRVMLLRCFYKRLIGEGMSSSEIINHDLYGMIHHYLIETKKELYRIKPKAKIHFEYFISKYYQHDIDDYLKFTLTIYEKYKGSYDIIQLTNIPSYLYASLYELSKRMIKNNNEEFDDLFRKKYEIDFQSLNDVRIAAKLFDDMNFKTNEFISILSSIENDINIEFESILKEHRNDFIISLISWSYDQMTKDTEKNGHTISIDLNVMAYLYYTIVQVYETNSKIKITKEMIYDKLFDIDNEEVTTIVSSYLRSRSIGFKL